MNFKLLYVNFFCVRFSFFASCFLSDRTKKKNRLSYSRRSLRWKCVTVFLMHETSGEKKKEKIKKSKRFHLNALRVKVLGLGRSMLLCLSFFLLKWNFNTENPFSSFRLRQFIRQLLRQFERLITWFWRRFSLAFATRNTAFCHFQHCFEFRKRNEWSEPHSSSFFCCAILALTS